MSVSENKELKQHALGVLFSQSNSFSNLQGNVFQHIVAEVQLLSSKICEQFQVPSDSKVCDDSVSFELFSLLLSASKTETGHQLLLTQPQLLHHLLIHACHSPARTQRTLLPIMKAIVENGNITDINQACPAIEMDGHCLRGLQWLMLFVIAGQLKLQRKQHRQGNQKPTTDITMLESLQSSSSHWARVNVTIELAQFAKTFLSSQCLKNTPWSSFSKVLGSKYILTCIRHVNVFDFCCLAGIVL
jgi:hypothetical protein